jgi:hypothetical protein
MTYGDIAARVRGDMRGRLAHLDVTPIHFTYTHQGTRIDTHQPLMYETPLHHRLRFEATKPGIISSTVVPLDAKTMPTQVISSSAPSPPIVTEEKKLTKKERWAITQQSLKGKSTVKKSGGGGDSETFAEPSSATTATTSSVTTATIVTAAMTRTAAESKTEAEIARRNGTFQAVDESDIETGCGDETVDTIELPIKYDTESESPLRCAIPECGSLVLVFKVRNPRETEFAVEESERGCSYYRAHHTHCLADAKHNYCVIRPQREMHSLTPLSYKCAWHHEPEVAEHIASSTPSAFPMISDAETLIRTPATTATD